MDAAASAPQMDVAKAKEGKHDDDMSAAARRAAAIGEQQDAERRSMQSPYGNLSMPGGKQQHPVYGEQAGPGGKDKTPPSKSRIEEEIGKSTRLNSSHL